MSKRYCQSCGMPLRFDMEEWLGTNLNGSKSDTFCYYCLKDGKYTVDVSMHEMIDIWLKYVNKYNMYAHTSLFSRRIENDIGEKTADTQSVETKTRYEECS